MPNDENVIEKTETHRVRLEYDEHTENPRLHNDGIVTSYIVTNNFPRSDLRPGQSRSRNISDVNTNSLSAAFEHFANRLYATWDNRTGRRLAAFAEPEDVFARWARIFLGKDIGVVVNNGAVWYTDPELADALEISILSDPSYPEMGVLITQGEVDEYNAWADGDVYGYIVEERVSKNITTITTHSDGSIETATTETEAWEEVDSCWGFIGREYAEEAAKEAVANFKGEVA